MNRRKFLKRGSVFVPAALAFPNIIKAQTFSGSLAVRGAAAIQGAPSSGSFSYTATAFSGGNSWLSHSGDMSGMVDGKTFALSLWFKLSDAAQDGTVRRLFAFGGDICVVYFESSSPSVVANDIFCVFQDTVGGNAVRVASNSTFVASSTWHHLALSFDATDNAKRFLYIDGASNTPNWVTYVNSTINFANGGDDGVNARASGTGAINGSLCEVWIAANQYVDLSTSITSFRSVAGKPVSLGSDGSTPTGSAPTIYLKNAAATFETNSGTGGNFTRHGTIADDPSIP